MVVVGEHAGHHVRVEHGSAGGHLPRRVDESADFRDAVLEEVTEAFSAREHELPRVELLDVLAKHQDRRATPRSPLPPVMLAPPAPSSRTATDSTPFR
jgi:hypothetical protein